MVGTKKNSCAKSSFHKKRHNASTLLKLNKKQHTVMSMLQLQLKKRHLPSKKIKINFTNRFILNNSGSIPFQLIIPCKENLNFQRNALRRFFEQNNMVQSEDNGDVCPANPRAVIHIFTPRTSTECVYIWVIDLDLRIKRGNRRIIQKYIKFASNVLKMNSIIFVILKILLRLDV